MYLSIVHSFMSINKRITFIHISRFILVSKSPPFTFFIWIFTNSITFFHGRFMYIHTFFHHKMMCGCRLATCLYDIQQTSYERRLHHNHVAPSEPIWAGFASILSKDISTTDSSRHVYPKPRRAAEIVYRHILLGENSFNLIRTRAHEKIRLDFFARRAIICTVYCWEKCKKL